MKQLDCKSSVAVGLFPGQPIPRLYDRAVECCALGIAESCVQRARRDYPD